MEGVMPVPATLSPEPIGTILARVVVAYLKALHEKTAEKMLRLNNPKSGS